MPIKTPFAALAFLGLALGLAAPGAQAAEVDVARLVGLSPESATQLDDRALKEARGAGINGNLIGGILGLTSGIVSGVTGAIGGEPGTGGGLIGGIDGLIDTLSGLGPMNIVMAQIGDTTVTHIGITPQSLSITQGGTTVSLCAGGCGATVSIGQGN